MLKPRGDARPAWELVARLGRALGYAIDWRKLSDVHAAMAPEAFGVLSESGRGSTGPEPGERPANSGPVPMAPVKPEVNV